MAISSPSPGRATALVGRRSECELLDGLIDEVRSGVSRTLVIRGEAGVGKTALLEYVVENATECRVVRALGVQSEMELPFAGLHQLLAPLLDRLEQLPAPQRDALRTAFGLSPGSPPDRFVVALAALNLVASVAEETPLVCIVDDQQWLDHASAQTIAFVARRLQAEAAGLVIATRATSGDLAGVGELVVTGLGERDARELLDSALAWPLDPVVRDRLVDETRGNPLALLEFARGLPPGDLAGGFGLPGVVPLSRSIESSFVRRLDALPAESRRLLVLAAADPVGDPPLIWRAAESLAIPVAAAVPAADAGLLEIGARVRFHHPLVRSAAYRSASTAERQAAHAALAEATDPEIDPDRRAWHLAQTTAGHDDRIAEELERSAARAHARGGLAAAAAFLERSALLTAEPNARVERLLAAASAKRDAGGLDAALGLLVAAEKGPLDELGRARLELLGGQIALQQRRGADAGRLLVTAARRLEPIDPATARETHLEALTGAMASDLQLPDGLPVAARAALAAPRGPGSSRASDIVLDAFATRLMDGFGAAAPLLADALGRLLALDTADPDLRRWLFLADGRVSAAVALELWDAEAFHSLAARQERFSRDTGALVHRQFALSFLARSHLFYGELTDASGLIAEDRLLAEVTGARRLGNAEMTLAAFRGEERYASKLIDATAQDAAARGWTVNLYAQSVLYNGLGRHDEAREAARKAFEPDQLGHGAFVVAELVEAASKTANTALLEIAQAWMAERAQAVHSEWALGIHARVRALMSEGAQADAYHRESLARLGRTRVRVELARGHLLYGEWLRRERRRVDARENLGVAHEMLTAMGLDAFADRARRELLATGATVRRRTVQARDELTAQERQIARLARDGLTNPEIAMRLFISPRTVQYHLRKVFSKLGIVSRVQLDDALSEDSQEGQIGHGV